MAIIRGVISTDLETKFRKKAMGKFGYSKGAISNALEEAVKEWIKTSK